MALNIIIILWVVSMWTLLYTGQAGRQIDPLEKAAMRLIAIGILFVGMLVSLIWYWR